MMQKLKKRWIFIIVFVILLSTGALAKRFKDVNAQDEATEVIPYKKPTGDVKKFLGIWMSNGYALQPATDSYVVVGNDLTLYTDQARSFVNRILTPGHTKYHTWYESTDGKTWKKVANGKSKNYQNYKITPNKTGTVYYQQETYWRSAIGTTAMHIYSKVATVHVLPEPVDATSVDVTTDDDYLYNTENVLINRETYAHAIPTPHNFTGTVSWSVDNTNLATIDENTGLITSNNKELSGELKVTATLHNPNGKDIYGSTTIGIGRGLDDQYVKAGNTATFSLRGNIGDLDEDEDSKYEVKWYKKAPITGIPSQLDVDSQALSYTTPETTLDDDGTMIYAIIRVYVNNKWYSHTTNEAVLHVSPEGGPDIEMTNTLSNETFNDGTNTSTTLFGVNNDDKIKYTDTLTNNSDTGTLTDAKYVLPLKDGTMVDSVVVDGQTLDEGNYELKKNTNTQAIDLIISNLAFKNRQSHQIEITTTVNGITKRSSSETLPYIYGKNDDNTEYQKVGSQEYLNYTLDLIATTPQDIDYGTINAINTSKTVARQDSLNSPNNVLDVDDMRRYKTPITVYIAQTDALKSGSNILSGHLRYYDNGESINLLSDSAEVAQTSNGESLNSIAWDKENGVLLYLDSNWNASGVYQTKLDWTIQDSV